MIARIILLLTLGYLSPAFAALQIYHGDTVTNDQQFPFVVAIYGAEGDEPFCTGSVIADTWVLTASHCVFDYDEDDNPSFINPEEIVVGTGYLAGNKPLAKKVISVKKIFTYTSKVDPTIQQDIALLKLNEPAGVTPVELPQFADAFPNLKSGSQLTMAVGYGWQDIKWSPECSTSPNSEECDFRIISDKYLHYGNEIIQSDTTMEDFIKKYTDLILPILAPSDLEITYNRTTMLGTMSSNGTTPCHGDSGGPLLLINQTNENTYFVQIGVVSWGIIPLTYTAYKKGYFDGVPGVYANLTNKDMLNFIKTTIKNNP